MVAGTCTSNCGPCILVLGIQIAVCNRKEDQLVKLKLVKNCVAKDLHAEFFPRTIVEYISGIMPSPFPLALPAATLARHPTDHLSVRHCLGVDSQPPAVSRS